MFQSHYKQLHTNLQRHSPGDPDCNDRGNCSADTTYPTCQCNDDWTGYSCELPCVYGTPQADFTCVCEPCVQKKTKKNIICNRMILYVKKISFVLKRFHNGLKKLYLFGVFKIT
jgi:hypothetical protein